MLNDANSALSFIASSLLNQSVILQPHYNTKTKDVHHFVRPHSSGDEDISELGLRPEGVIQGLVVNVRQNVHNKKRAEIKIHGNHTIVYIRFGVSAQEERERIGRHVKLKILNNAWLLEKELASENRLSMTRWTDDQKQELLLKGRVSGVNAMYVRDISVFPELLDDPRNVEFVAAENDSDSYENNEP